MTKVSYVTAQGLEKLMKDLEHLETVERPSISQQIAEARDKGDLSENAEYDAAKEAQGMLEMKISKLKDTIANSRILDQSKLNTDTVQILNKVKADIVLYDVSFIFIFFFCEINTLLLTI